MNRFHATDGTSGLSAACQAAFPSGDRDVSTGTSQGSAVTVASGACSDIAGNVAASIDSAVFKIDLTAPVITNTGVQSGVTGSNGWYVSAVVNRFHVTDATSGLNAACQLAFPSGNHDVSTGSLEGTGLTVASGPCTDVAGNNAAGIDSAAFKIDLTDPSVTITAPSTGVSTIALAVQVKGTSGDTPSGISTVTVNGVSTDNAASWTTSGTVNLNCGANTLTALATDNAGPDEDGVDHDHAPLLRAAVPAADRPDDEHARRERR